MKKILGWIVSGVMFVYGVIMTLEYIGSQKLLEDEQEKRKKIVERHKRIIEKVSKEGICDLDTYNAKQLALCQNLSNAKSEEEFEEMIEEHDVRGVLFKTLMNVKFHCYRNN